MKAGPDRGPRQRHVVVRRRRIAYLDVGDHPRTCLLIHGFCASSRYWTYVIDRLAETHRVIAVDLPGFGDSEVGLDQNPAAQPAIVEEFCRLLGVGPVDVIGHSMGAWIACDIAARYPELVRRIVLTGGPSVSVADLFRTPLRAIGKHPRQTGAALLETATAWLSVPGPIAELITTRPWARRIVFAPYVARPEQLSADAVAIVLDGFGAPGALMTARQGSGYDLRIALDTMAVPVLVIAGADDKLVPASDVEAFIAADPENRHLCRLDDTGHMPMLERPARFAELADGFLNSTA